jgi:hypothetical protein
MNFYKHFKVQLRDWAKCIFNSKSHYSADYELQFRIVWIDQATKPMAMKALYNIYNVPGVCNKYEIIVYMHIIQYYI